jgi:hypothetical protein
VIPVNRPKPHIFNSHPDPDIQHANPRIRHPDPDIRHPDPSIRHLDTDIGHPGPDIREDTGKGGKTAIHMDETQDMLGIYVCMYIYI